MISSTNPLVDAMFMFESIGWLRWVVVGAFVLLGFLSGRLHYRGRSRVATAGGSREKPPLKLKPVSGSDGESAEGEFGMIYDSKPERIDDLQKIRGIGKATRSKLNGLGIYQFSQIANWGELEIAAISSKLGLGGQIVTEEWREQAKKFGDSAG